MSYSNNRIIAPVSIRDVQRALGVSVQDLGTLCKHANINKWARYKPVRSTSKIVRPITFNERKAVNFGLDVPWCANYRITTGGQIYIDMLNGIAYAIAYNEGDFDFGWPYLTPRGGNNNEPYRLTDFVRNPNETTPNANGDPTPVNLQGYNHTAKIPFTSFVNGQGITEREDISYGPYYEINRTIANQIIVTFFNSVGDDLHLQDFINIASPDASGRAWRPVLQIFRDWYAAGGDPWYERSNIDNVNDFQVAGDVITSDDGATFSVVFNVGNLHLNEYYHLCIGIGLVNTTFSSWGSGDNLFIAPYTDEQVDSGFTPFYALFKVVEYNARTFEVLAMQYFNAGTVRWVDAGGTAPTFEIGQNASGAIGLTLTVTKLPTQKVDFVAQNGSAQTTGAVPMVIQAREMIPGEQGETTFYLTPSVGPTTWASAQYIPVPEGQTSETVTLYATLNVSNIPVGGYGEYHLYASTDGGEFVNIGYFSIHKV